MPSQSSINLLKSSAVLTPQMKDTEGKLALVARIVLIATLVVSIGTAIVYALAVSQHDALEEQKIATQRQIAALSEKEVLVANIKNRITIADAIVESQIHWEELIDVILDVAVPPFLRSIGLGEENEIQMSLVSPALDDMKRVVDDLVALDNASRITNPTLESLVIDEEGSIRMNIVFRVAL